MKIKTIIIDTTSVIVAAILLLAAQGDSPHVQKKCTRGLSPCAV